VCVCVMKFAGLRRKPNRAYSLVSNRRIKATKGPTTAPLGGSGLGRSQDGLFFARRKELAIANCDIASLVR
jgi:hypothetical protein